MSMGVDITFNAKSTHTLLLLLLLRGTKGDTHHESL